MRLTRLFAIAGAILALLVCGMLGRLLWEEWQHYRAADTGHQTLRLVQQAMIAAEKIAYERGPVNAVLGDHLPPDPARQQRLLRARADTDNALAQLARALADAQLETAPTSLVPLTDALRAARLNIDQLAALAPPAHAGAAAQRHRAHVPASTHATRQRRRGHARVGTSLSAYRPHFDEG